MVRHMNREYEEQLRELVTDAVMELESKYGDTALEHLKSIYFEVLRRIQQEIGPL